jgi:hypothetical protein
MYEAWYMTSTPCLTPVSYVWRQRHIFTLDLYGKILTHGNGISGSGMRAKTLAQLMGLVNTGRCLLI